MNGPVNVNGPDPVPVHARPATQTPASTAHGCGVRVSGARRVTAPRTPARAAPLALAALLATAPLAAQGPTRVIDDFRDVAAWSAHPSDGVTLRITADSAGDGHAMRLDFDFHGGGYAIARRALPLDLPPNYEFAFRIRGDAPPENLEFKLVDPTGDNVWWLNRRNFTFPTTWQRLRTKKRQIEFAWGPAGGGEMTRVGSIEIVVTAGSGGRGTVWIDDLTFTPLPPITPYDLTPAAMASSARPGGEASKALDGDTATEWRSRGMGEETLVVDFGKAREYGGIVLDWGVDYATDYDVETSTDGRAWTAAYRVRGGNGGRDYVPMPETESRWLRLVLHRGRRAAGFTPPGYALRELRVQPLAFGATRNGLLEAVAADAPRGSWPRYLSGHEPYWTVVGAPGDTVEALFDTDARLEPFPGSFSIEPFVYAEGRLYTWADGAGTPSLARDHLPIPSVRRAAGPAVLTVTTWAGGPAGASTLYARYRLENPSAERCAGTLFLAVRPLQVNPPSQVLNAPGGAAEIHSLAYAGGAVVVDGRRRIVPLTRPAGFGAATFDGGGIAEALRTGWLPHEASVTDSTGLASGALAFPFELPPRATRAVVVAIPLHAASSIASGEAAADSLLAATIRDWSEALDRVTIELPPSAADVANTIRSNLAYILINRDGPGIQPGSRAYSRSWIRDGALTSAALLRLGHAAEVREFAEWYARHLYPSGKVPCCVDRRGADPVPENDSNGEFVFLVAEYFRFTHDTAFVRALWPKVRAATLYIDSLRQQRRTAEYRAPDKQVLFGLLPQSISHEGYSAKPMHSYWDDLFALRGLKDAAFLAGVLRDDSLRDRFAAWAAEFRGDLYASMRRSMAEHRIDYIPGAAELGDFDATSTTIALAPVGELGRLPEPALHRTFERYYENFVARRDGRVAWDAYTPYELRAVGTFVRLGEREKAHELLDFFLRDRRPPQWNQWAEVVWKDPDTPKFIGDMPHTWVGSDFIRSALDMFAYADERDSTLVVAAGVPAAWLEGPGVRVAGLRTEYGPLDMTLRREAGVVRIRLAGEVAVPPGGIVVRPPLASPRRVTVNGNLAAWTGDGVVVRRLPADIVIVP
ncbi:MAG: discoidin domain-containing protein [Gemmatimonadetes bacterium]|nr:discoidin domain-containing protein [Gemmatimonadota bacterium]